MSLQPRLNVFDTTMIVVSLVIGIGIFRTPAMVAAATGTPFLFFLAWGLGGLVSLFGALTYAEIGSRFPKPGAYYKVVAETMHSGLAFLLNWTGVVIQNGAGAAAIAFIGAEYLNPILLPPHLQTTHAVTFTAAALVLILLLINWLGIRFGASVQNGLTLVKIAMILGLIGVAFLGSASGRMDSGSAFQGRSLWTALGVGFISVFYTYGGYQNTINFGGDVRNASSRMPKAIVAGVLLVIALYIAINAAYVRVLGIAGVAVSKLVAADVAEVCLGPAARIAVSLIITLSALGFLNVMLMQVPRVYHAMAEDRVFPAILGRINPRTQAQEAALLFLGGTIFLFIFVLGTFEKLVNCVMFVDSISLAVVAASVFVLRHRAGSDRTFSGFRMPLYPWLTVIYIFFLLVVTVHVVLDDPRAALFGVAVVGFGFPLFLLLRRIFRGKR